MHENGADHEVAIEEVRFKGFMQADGLWFLRKDYRKDYIKHKIQDGPTDTTKGQGNRLPPQWFLLFFILHFELWIFFNQVPIGEEQEQWAKCWIEDKHWSFSELEITTSVWGSLEWRLDWWTSFVIRWWGWGLKVQR